MLSGQLVHKNHTDPRSPPVTQSAIRDDCHLFVSRIALGDILPLKQVFLCLVVSYCSPICRHVSCLANADCTSLDYQPEYSTCVGGLTTVTFTKNTDCSGGLATPEPIVGQPCGTTSILRVRTGLNNSCRLPHTDVHAVRSRIEPPFACLLSLHRGLVPRRSNASATRAKHPMQYVLCFCFCFSPCMLCSFVVGCSSAVQT